MKRLNLGPSRTTPSGLSRQLQAKAPEVSIASSQLSLKLSMMLGIASTSMTSRILGAILLMMRDPRKVGHLKALLRRERLSSGWAAKAHPRSRQLSSLDQRPLIANMTSRQMMRMTSHFKNSREAVSVQGLISVLSLVEMVIRNGSLSHKTHGQRLVGSPLLRSGKTKMTLAGVETFLSCLVVVGAEMLAPERVLARVMVAFLPLMVVPLAPLMTKTSIIRKKRRMRKPTRTRMRWKMTSTKTRKIRVTQTSRMRTASISQAVEAPQMSLGSRRLRFLAPMMKMTRKVADSMSLQLSHGLEPPATALRNLRLPKSASKVSQSLKGERMRPKKRPKRKRLSRRTTLAPRVWGASVDLGQSITI